MVVRIVSPGSEEANSCDMLVCLMVTNPLFLPDNLTSSCSHCGTGVQFRPDVPPKPPKVCYACALKAVGQN